MGSLARSFAGPVHVERATECLALDIGGVITADIWETLCHHGLADACGLSVPRALELGRAIWPDHAYRSGTEDEFWQDWEDRTGRTIDRTQIDRMIAAHLWHDPSVVGLVTDCLAAGMDVCLVSNNTEFFIGGRCA